MKNLDICRMSAIELAAAIRTKKLSPVEVVNAILDRIDRINPIINAYCTIVSERALTEARLAEQKVMHKEPLGLLHGVPVSIKDLLFTKGIRTTGGSKLFENFVPEVDDIAVERLKKAGAIILGKTNLSEFGWSAVTAANPLFGETRNPWNSDYNTGGSSGGAAAAMAACLAPLALGSDGGGSVRIPSSFCGVFGFKPGFGRIPWGPGFWGPWEGLETSGPISRTVTDAALMLEVLSGYDSRDSNSIHEEPPHYLANLGKSGSLKGLKVAWSPDFGFIEVDNQVSSVTKSAAEVFETLGCFVEEDSPDAEPPQDSFSTQVAATLATHLKEHIEERERDIDPALVKYIKRNNNIDATDYVDARHKQLEYSDKIRVFFEKYDLLLTPTLAVPPFKIGTYKPTEINGKSATDINWKPFTYPFNVTGQPAASIPCGFTANGLPVGLQIVGRRYDELSVLRAAAAFEKANPQWNRYPPLD